MAFARDGRVSGHRRSLTMVEQFRGLSLDLRISNGVLPWQGKIMGCQVAKRNQLGGISTENGIMMVFNV